MKKYLALLIPFFAVLLTLPVLSQTKFVEHKVGHIYYMSIPNYMSKTLDLNNAASLQYSNVKKEAYVIVIDDSKEDLEMLNEKFTGPKDFFDDFMKNFSTKGKENSEVSASKELLINGNKAVQAEMTAMVDSTNIYYFITVVETKTHFYKILAWTLKDNKDALKSDYVKMVATFRD